MITDRFQQESSTANQFSFFNPKSTASRGRRSLDSVDYAVWAERMKGAWSRRAPFGGHRRGRKYEGDEGIKRLGGEEDEEEKEDSGTPSPPLWKGGSPRRSQCQPLIDKQVAGVPVRAQEIARFRQELLERVRGVAEADYELSLRDMVQSPPAPSPEKSEKEMGQSMGKKNGKGKSGVLRSERMGSGGFLLKMLSFPISVGEGKRRDRKAPVPPRSKVLAEKKGGIGEDRGGEGRRRRRELGGIGSSSNSSTSSSNSNGSSSSSSSMSSSNSSGGSSSSCNCNGNGSNSSNSNSRIKRMSSCYSFFGKNRERELDI